MCQILTSQSQSWKYEDDDNTLVASQMTPDSLHIALLLSRANRVPFGTHTMSVVSV